MHYRKKWKRPLIIRMTKALTRRDGRKLMEYEGIGKAEVDILPDGKEEELLPDNSTFWNRPQWFRSSIEWVADPDWVKYPRRLGRVFSLDGTLTHYPLSFMRLT